MSVAKFSGIVTLAELNPATGKIKTGHVDVGEVDALEFGFNVQEQKKFSKRDCNYGLIASVESQIDNNFNMTFGEALKGNLEKMLRGVAPTVASASVSAEALHEGSSAVVAGQYLYTKKPIRTLTSIVDSAGSPATLTLGTDYELTDAATGKIKMLNVAGYTQPFKANYTAEDYSPVPFLNDSIRYYELRFSGVNCVSLEKVGIHIYRVKLNPIQQFQVLSDNFNAFQTAGQMFADATKTADAQFGSYGRIWQM